MRLFEIWCEGFSCSGNSTKAKLLGLYFAATWEDAVKMYIKNNPNKIVLDERGYTYWGCRLFSNEADARKSFG